MLPLSLIFSKSEKPFLTLCDACPSYDEGSHAHAYSPADQIHQDSKNQFQKKLRKKEATRFQKRKSAFISKFWISYIAFVPIFHLL